MRLLEQSMRARVPVGWMSGSASWLTLDRTTQPSTGLPGVLGRLLGGNARLLHDPLPLHHILLDEFCEVLGRTSDSAQGLFGELLGNRCYLDKLIDLFVVPTNDRG